MPPTRRSYRSRSTATRLSLLRLVLAMALGPTPSSAAGGDWWTPTARPAPDVGIDVTGEPFTGTDPAGKVRGFVDAHNHLIGNEAFGGRAARFTGTPARYVRVHGLGRGTGWGYSLYEVGVHGA